MWIFTRETGGWRLVALFEKYYKTGPFTAYLLFPNTWISHDNWILMLTIYSFREIYQRFMLKNANGLVCFKHQSVYKDIITNC